MFTDVKSVSEITMQENGLCSIEVVLSERLVNQMKPMLELVSNYIPLTVGKLHDGSVAEFSDVRVTVISSDTIKMEFEEDSMTILEDFDLHDFTQNVHNEEYEQFEREYIEELRLDSLKMDDIKLIN